MDELVTQLQRKTKALADPKRAATNRWFFKTGKGQYGEGDQFLGLTSRQMHDIAKEFRLLPLPDLQRLLKNPYHEQRQIALYILVDQFGRSSSIQQKHQYRFYLANTRWINNWDLVDCSAHKIVGRYLREKPHDVLTGMAASKNVWERRISIIATLDFIAHRSFNTTLSIATILLQDPHDLIQKGVGWMLREVGKRDEATLKQFLNRHAPAMPRTMLRYAIERLPEAKRRAYMRQ
ncbi:DNA alkylation repair protein [Candidatus Uhrbacteria bacterium]|nr:DNA alkylation repair protein [Candidatus Uhrbacteria bacterium]